MKYFRKITASLMLIIFVTGSGVALLILHPQPLFAHELHYKNFSVYSNEEITEDIQRIIDATNQLVAHSELHDPEYQFDLFLSHNTLYNRVDNLLGSIQAARATDNNIVIKIPVDIANNMATSTRSKVDVTQLIAHEMIHCLQANRYGKRAFNPWNHPPMWKLEGYPEYISRKTMRKHESYSLLNEITRFIDLEKTSKDGWVEVSHDHMMPVIYYKGRLMMEYMMDIQGLTYDQVLDDAIVEEDVYENMMAWYRSNIKKDS